MLVGKVYKDSQPEGRRRILAHLLKPLGVLSLLPIANGAFAKMRLRSDWTSVQFPLEDTKEVQANDVIALVDYVQQVSFQVVDGMARLFADQPALAGSAAATILVAMLIKRAQFRRVGDRNS